MLDILRESAQQVVDNFAANLSTSIPGVVVRVDPERMRADIRPSVSKLYEDGEIEESPILLDVPIIMPGTRESLISLPVQAGDSVLLVFAQRDTDNWNIGDTNEAVPASTMRAFGAQDAFAIPGAYPAPRSPNRASIRKWPHSPKDLTLAMNIGTASEVELRLSQTGNLVINTAGDVLLNADNMDVTLTGQLNVTASTADITASQTTVHGNATVIGDAKVNGNVTVTGNTTITGILTVAGINMNTHTHGGVMSGPSFTSGPV